MFRVSSLFVVLNRSGQPRAVFTTRKSLVKWLNSERVPFIYSIAEVPSNTFDPSSIRYHDVRDFLLEG